MKKIAATTLVAACLTSFMASCSPNQELAVVNGDNTFSDLESDFKVTDIRGYGCQAIEPEALKHVLESGVVSSPREIHDHYSSVGCLVEGKVTLNGQVKRFKFDYGGVFYFENSLILACGKTCCENDFEYCTCEE